jgi:hypothetical protein
MGCPNLLSTACKRPALTPPWVWGTAGTPKTPLAALMARRAGCVATPAPALLPLPSPTGTSAQQLTPGRCGVV